MNCGASPHGEARFTPIVNRDGRYESDLLPRTVFMPPRLPRSCYRCPKLTQDSAVPAAPPLNSSVLYLTVPTEGDRLWRHVLFGTGTCIGMIEGYHSLGMPGNPMSDLVSLRDRLNNVINKFEAKDESPVPEERLAPADTFDSEDVDVEHDADA